MKHHLVAGSILLCALTLPVYLRAADAAGDASSRSRKPEITRADAARTALALVPGGRIREGELEREKGHLVWSFDIARPNTRDITEVLVDAVDGKVVSRSVETPADQAREAAADAASARKNAKPAGK